MLIEIAKLADIQNIAKLDTHIPKERLTECVRLGHVYVLKDDSACTPPENAPIVGTLRYSLFWQTIPFLDLLYISRAFRRMGHGTEMMRTWEEAMKKRGYEYVMTSTQADEDAWAFYEKLGYRRAGGFFPPEQDAEEWIYLKKLELSDLR